MIFVRMPCHQSVLSDKVIFGPAIGRLRSQQHLFESEVSQV